MYYYSIYGLVIESQVYLPEANPAESTASPEVTVRYGTLAHDITQHPETKNPGGIWYYCFPGDNLMWFRAGGIDFEVSGGTRIVIDKHGGQEDETSLRIYLLGTALGTIHMQRGNVPVHGASIERGNGATIITGYSGSGKSAVLGALAPGGYRFLADDVSVVRTKSGIPEVFPGYPQRKIACEDAAALRYDTADLEIINEDNRDKYVIRKAGEWCPESRPLVAIVEIVSLSREDGGPVVPDLTEIKGHAALTLVMRNLYRRSFYGATGIGPDIMKKILILTSGIRTYQLIRPVEGMPVSEAAGIIIEACGALASPQTIITGETGGTTD